MPETLPSLTANGQKLIDRLLALPQGWVTAAMLAESIGVSRRTVLRELPSMEQWIAAAGYRFVRSPGQGLLLDEPPARREQMRALLNGSTVYAELPRRQRRQKLLGLLLQAREPMKTAALARELLVSESTLAADLDEIGQWVSSYAVTLHRRPGVGVWLKGDIPIGISRTSVEAWTAPHLFHLDGQAGAPPDAFSTTGQNWGFPTYNWEAMAQDGYQWWQRRLTKMAQYFDAYRIDHVLGFFRIWQIPRSCVDGLLGHFEPSLPMSREEIEGMGLNIDPALLTEPHITDSLIDSLFGAQAAWVREHCLTRKANALYCLRSEWATQRQINDRLPNDGTDMRTHLRQGLMRLTSQVLFIADEQKVGHYLRALKLSENLPSVRLPMNSKRHSAASTSTTTMSGTTICGRNMPCRCFLYWCKPLTCSFAPRIWAWYHSVCSPCWSACASSHWRFRRCPKPTDSSLPTWRPTPIAALPLSSHTICPP